MRDLYKILSQVLTFNCNIAFYIYFYDFPPLAWYDTRHMPYKMHAIRILFIVNDG